MDNNIKIFISTILFIAYSCFQTNKPTVKLNVNVPKEDTCRDSFKPDIKINEIELSNNNSSLRGYSKLEKLVIEDNQELPYVSFINKKETEKLTVYFFYGSGYDEFYQFKIEPYEKGKPDNYLDYDNFVTESGIKLGITKGNLINIKGNNYTENYNSIKYILSNYENSCFLKKYNLPVYFSEYTFKDNKLIKIYFGFEYP